MELLAEQKQLINTGRQLELDAESLFGAQIAQSVAQNGEIEKEIEDMRNECDALDIEIRCVRMVITFLDPETGLQALRTLFSLLLLLLLLFLLLVLRFFISQPVVVKLRIHIAQLLSADNVLHAESHRVGFSTLVLIS